ncbi:MAG: endonuclease MutS2 [Chlorobi bacterium]|nr:endonuclease MutS2 [Chlorobiota bacterium]
MNDTASQTMTDVSQQSSLRKKLSDASLEELEFAKVLELVAPLTLTERAAEHVRSLRPMLDAETLESVHAAIAEILLLHGRGDDLPLERTDDPRRLLHRSTIAGAYLSASELLAVVELLGVSRRVRHFLSQRNHEFPRLAAVAESLVDVRLLERHIRDAIDPTGAVRDDASPQLQRIRTAIADVSARLRSKLHRIIQRLGDEELLQDEFYTQRDGRLVVPLKVEYKRSLPGIIHGISQSGATVFFEPSEVFELNNELAELRSAEEREVIAILRTLTAEVGAHAEKIAAADAALTELDSLRARALFAQQYRCHLPRIASDGTIELRNVRHPLLVVAKGYDSVVPLSVTFDRQRRGYLVSGPNAGGKSIAIKTIGVATIMALAGIYPIGEMTISPVMVLAAIGDHQSIESNLSTFSSQLVRLRDILSICDGATLAIVDEICAGTDPTEGSALAAGIIDALLDRGGYIVATTHQFTLKTYALSRDGLLNASMEFDTENLVPTYRFLPGVPGNSYALELARALQLPDEVIQRSRCYVGSEHERIETSIQQLERLRADMEQKAADAARLRLEAENLRKRYEEKFEQFKAKYLALMDAARSEAQQLVVQTKEQLRQIREQAVQQSLDEARKKLGQLDEQLSALSVPTKSSPSDAVQLAIGVTAEVLETHQRGTIVELTPKHAVLEVGAVRLKVPVEKLRRVEPSDKTSIVSNSNRRPVRLDAPTTLDVRGLRVQDALGNIEQVLNDAVLGGVMQVTIIHGSGTGQLREAIHRYLSDHPLVASFRLGESGQTDWGTTYVQLR